MEYNEWPIGKQAHNASGTIQKAKKNIYPVAGFEPRRTVKGGRPNSLGHPGLFKIDPNILV